MKVRDKHQCKDGIHYFVSNVIYPAANTARILKRDNIDIFIRVSSNLTPGNSQHYM